MSEFLTDALSFFGDEPQRYGTPRLQLNRLSEHLRRTSALLVLDGAERLLRVYSRVDAAYLDDAEAEAGQPHGRDYARCDGPPYAYQPALAEAGRLLKLLSGEVNHGDAQDTEENRGEIS